MSSSRENEFEDNSINALASFPPPRTPLNSIPDPSQYYREDNYHDLDFHSKYKVQTTRAGGKLSTKRNENPGANYVTPRLPKKPNSEPNSTQTTPARTTSRVSLGGAATGSRTMNFSAKGKEISSVNYRVSRAISLDNSDFSIQVPHFELDEDPSFWADRNVQVLIRIRPLSNMEKVSQGYGRCLKQESSQTLTWLGHPETRFTFDHIACETMSQEKLFKVVGLPMVENCMSGYNSCMFAYGQTGSGKTYTMMGEINQLDNEINNDCGITPRIFEYLFSRIRMEEESRRNEKLRFSCKCSFLEIYNEQITDLLEPSSTNLQLREDSRKGVYVENLTEYNVKTVNDIIKLLSQGAATRKIAATNMNSESSRSHSVFTCIIESWWEKDSMTHFRFARLNLVDLAGSERQKSSGAEGDRLKEAANINKSLSTLGLVIMSLIDLAHGKHRHVPYRDSRLTFLLQDSLGGNSKTTIIANISPSMCSAHETLSTLKFAQRAKLIQNNAKVNEDASGDVSTLQRQIQQLKDQLSFLIKHHNLSGTLPSFVSSFEEFSLASSKENRAADSQNLASIAFEKMKSMEAILVGALRREKVAEKEFNRLESEIDYVNQLACQYEEELQRTKMMLRLREAKNKHLEFLVDGSLQTDHYLMDENKALKEEIALLQATVDKNPDLTRLTLENIRLHEQLQVFQNFYENGERETLLAETSEIRDQLLDVLERKLEFSSRNENQVDDILEELEDCRNTNFKLLREVEGLKTELKKCSNVTEAAFDTVKNSSIKGHEEIRQSEKYSEEQNCQYMEVLEKKNKDTTESVSGFGRNSLQNLETQSKSGGMEGIEEIKITTLQETLEKLTKDLENTRLLNFKYQEDQALQLSNRHQIEIINEQVETETTKTIIYLQEEVTALQLELNEKLLCMSQENLKLRNNIEAKEEEIRTLCWEWENATFELTSFLMEGSKSLDDATCQIKSIVSSYPQVNVFIRERVERAARACIDKEEAILWLEKSLEDAQKMVTGMELKINSLKVAAVALNEFPQSNSDQSAEAIINLDILLNEKMETIKLLEGQLKCKEESVLEAKNRADALLLVVKWLSEWKKVAPCDKIIRDLNISKIVSPNLEDIKTQTDLESLIMESKSAIGASLMDTEVQITALQRETLEASTTYKNCVQELVNEIQEMRSKCMELKENYTGFSSSAFKLHASESLIFHSFENQGLMYPIKDELAKLNERLKVIDDSISKKITAHCYPLTGEYLAEADSWSSDNSMSSYSPSGSDFANDIVASSDQLDELSNSSCSKFSGKIAEDMADLTLQIGSAAESGSSDLKKLLKEFHQDESKSFFLRKELDLAFDSFKKLYAHLTIILDENDNVDISHPRVMHKNVGLEMETGENFTSCDIEATSENKVNHVHGNTFVCKFEEARATMKEADQMLNALLKANENAKELNEKWKQASKQLLVERLQLVEENKQLKASINLKDERGKLELDGVENSISVLEGCFLEMQREVDDSYKGIYSELLCMGKEMLQLICDTRLSLEDILSEIMKMEFTRSVIYQCVVGDIIHKIPSFDVQSENQVEVSALQKFINNRHENVALSAEKLSEGVELFTAPEEGEQGIPHDSVGFENLSLKKELERKEALLKGLHFDFSLLQEAASKRKDIKDETERLFSALSEVRLELERKTSQFDKLLFQYKKVESYLADTKDALSTCNSDLSHAKERIDILSGQNAELRMLLKDLYLRKSEAEEQLEEQKEAVKGLETEIIQLSSLVEEKIRCSIEGLEEDLRRVADERDKLREEICSLNDKLEMAYALADENEAVAVESRQESEASKLYAEQKEEEVKILEHSVEELESTINVMETKVFEMDQEVERHRLIRESLEMELQALRHRLLTVGNLTDIVDTGNTISVQIDDNMSRTLSELHEAQCQIKLFERDVAEKDQEIKLCKEYISELVLHSEAQASQYQDKYKTLEAMVHEVKTNLVSSSTAAASLDKNEKSSIRTRGSSSPFRCISNLVQQMNLEKDQELSVARHRVEELEAMVASRQKEVCMLNARLAAAESMTHDVIRDLLGVKLDMTNYANLIDQQQVQRLVEAAQQQTEESNAKDQEILKLKRRINDLTEENESCISEMNKKGADILSAQMTLEQLQDRDQLLSAQNEMLKMDKTNLLKKVAELDDMLKTLLGTQSSRQQRTSKVKENGALKLYNGNLTKRLAHSEKLISRVNDELAQYRQSSSNQPHFKPGSSSRR